MIQRKDNKPETNNTPYHFSKIKMVTTERDYVRRTVGENTQEKQADVERERDDDDRVSKSEQRESALENK